MTHREAADSLLESIISWARERTEVSCLLAFGSLARGDFDDYSDFDLVILSSSTGSIDKLVAEFTSLFETEFVFDIDEKHILLLRRPFMKIEFYVLSRERLSELKQYFVETRFENEEHAILFDRTQSLGSVLADWTAARNPVDPRSFVNIAYQFLYYYEGFYPPFFRGDAYRAFFQYSLAFFKLATLVGIARGVRHHLYAPRNVTVRASGPDAERLRSVSPVMDPIELFRRKLPMFDFFGDLVKRLGLESEFPSDRLTSIRTNLVNKYPPFWQLRDIGHVHGVRTGMVFRCATLTKYRPEEFRSWATSVGLRTIIDLRTEEEVENSRYDRSVIRNIRYVHLPLTITPSNAKTTTEADYFPRLLEFYRSLPYEGDFKTAIRKTFEVISDARNLPLLIHCYRGTDRTGMVIAVLLKAIGVPDKEIVRDYLLSYRTADARLLEKMFDTFSKEGGLRGCGVAPETVARTKHVLSVPEGASEVANHHQ